MSIGNAKVTQKPLAIWDFFSTKDSKLRTNQHTQDSSVGLPRAQSLSEIHKGEWGTNVASLRLSPAGNSTSHLQSTSLGSFFVVSLPLADNSGTVWGIAPYLPGTQHVCMGLEKSKGELGKSESMFQRQSYRTPAMPGEWQITFDVTRTWVLNMLTLSFNNAFH